MDMIDEDTYSNRYDFVEILGSGSYSRVILSIDKKDGLYYAVKQMDLREETEKIVLNEIDNLKVLSYNKNGCYQGIVCYYDVFKDTPLKKIYIVTEYIPGVTLTEFMKYIDVTNLTNIDFYNDNILYIIKKILETLEYIHSRNIIHGDIKPDNIMIYFDKYLKDKFELPSVEELIANNNNKLYIPVLIDFGFSCVVNIDDFCKDEGETPYYTAPEVMKDYRKYKKSDIWSLGMTLAVITGFDYFMRRLISRNKGSMEKALLNIKQSNIPEFDTSSEKINKLLELMLQVNINDRLTASQLLDLF